MQGRVQTSLALPTVPINQSTKPLLLPNSSPIPSTRVGRYARHDRTYGRADNNPRASRPLWQIPRDFLQTLTICFVRMLERIPQSADGFYPVVGRSSGSVLLQHVLGLRAEMRGVFFLIQPSPTFRMEGGALRPLNRSPGQHFPGPGSFPEETGCHRPHPAPTGLLTERGPSSAWP